MRIWYRITQFLQAASAGPLPETALAEVRQYLNAAELELFLQAPIAEQTHAYHVFRTLRAAGERQPDLLKAALLHDMGKACAPLTLWQRSIVVLGERLWPAASHSWSSGEARGWKRPFVVRKRHPEWGAKMAEAAGSQALTVTLIRQHQEGADAGQLSHEEEQLLQRLQWADDQN